MTQKESDLKTRLYELLKNATSDSDFIAINALEAACLILDNKFGNGFHKENPELAVKMSESIMKNIRVEDMGSKIKYGIGEYIDALRIVILQKEFPLTGAITVDIPDVVRVE